MRKTSSFTSVTVGLILIGPVMAAPLTDVTAYHTSPGLARASVVPQYAVFEVTFAEPVNYGAQKNFTDISISVILQTPVSGKQVTIGGFYYDTLADGKSLWKARFAPAVVGAWTYTYTFTHTPTGNQATGAGVF
jgi:hypothetical protein